MLDRDRMVELLSAVGRALDDHDAPMQELIVVGGAYMALSERRSMSEDVDTLGALTPNDPYLATMIDEIEVRIARDGLRGQTSDPWLFGWDDTTPGDKR